MLFVEMGYPCSKLTYEIHCVRNLSHTGGVAVGNPRKRTTISTEAIGDGLGVFDPAQNKTYLLNATSALVWQHCDGNTSPQELTALLVRKFNVTETQAEELMRLALDELTNFNLLETEVQPLRGVPQSGLTRRQMLARVAAVGISAALLPIVSPVVAKADRAKKLIPLLNCVTNNGNGTLTAHFGYLNQTPYPINVPLGANVLLGQVNTFLPPPGDRGQPAEFEPGEHDFVFQVTFDYEQVPVIVWILKAEGDFPHEVAASEYSEPCPTTTTPPVTTTPAPTTPPPTTTPPIPTTTAPMGTTTAPG
jgi:Coenzyme PQQ synthesis protein D (PqqD)